MHDGAIVVTGAAGFIGSNVVAALNERGLDNVILCDWLKHDQRWLNLRKRSFRDFIPPEDLLAYLTRVAAPKAIIHLGANSSTTTTDGDELMRVNYRYTLDLLDYCAEQQVIFIYASSAATYGAGENGFFDYFDLTELNKLQPLNLYGWSKHLVDKVLADRKQRGASLPPKCTGLKYFNVYGQNEYHKGDMISVVGKNYHKAIANETISLFKSHKEGFVDGGQLRDFIYVNDAVDVTLWFLENGPENGIFNVGTGRASSFRELIEALYSAVGREPKIDYIPMPEHLREKYQYFTEASTVNLRAAGYSKDFANVIQGVDQYVRYLSSDDTYR